MTGKIQGKIRWFNEKKGFGFIEAKGKDYLVHTSEIKNMGFKTLIGASVLFIAGQGKKGLQAEEVEII